MVTHGMRLSACLVLWLGVSACSSSGAPPANSYHCLTYASRSGSECYRTAKECSTMRELIRFGFPETEKQMRTCAPSSPVFCFTYTYDTETRDFCARTLDHCRLAVSPEFELVRDCREVRDE